MRKKELIKQLNSLQHKIKADADWKESNRQILVSQIKGQSSLDFVQNNKTRFFTRVLPKNIFLPVLKPVASLVLIVFFVGLAWTASVSATKNSLPGDLFYNIKLTTERVQASLTLNNEKRANLEMKFAGRRLDEIVQLMADSELDHSQHLNLPLQKFQENMTNVKNSLAKLEKSDKEAAVKMANLVNEKAKEYVVLLEDQQQKLAINAEEAILASKSTGDKAFALIIQEYETNQTDLSTDQIKEKVQNRINDLQIALNKSKNDIDTIINNQKIAAEAAKAAEEAAKAEQEAAEAEAAEEEAEDATEKESGSNQETETEAEESDNESADQADESDVAVTETEEQLAEESVESNESADNQANIDDSGQESGNDNQSDNQLSEEQQPQEETAMLPAPTEILPSIEETIDLRTQALTLLIDAENLLKDNKVNQAFDLIKQADDKLALIKKVILANSDYLSQEQEEVNEVKDEASEDSEVAEAADEVVEE